MFVWIDHGGGFKTTYAHLSQTTVQVGDTVQAGDVVGVCSSTGKSTGLHLHFEIFVNGRRVDPAPYIGLEYAGVRWRSERLRSIGKGDGICFMVTGWIVPESMSCRMS